VGDADAVPSGAENRYGSHQWSGPCRGVQQAVNGQTISWQKPNVVLYLSDRQDERREGLG
jgi:hypothetical protein